MCDIYQHIHDLLRVPPLERFTYLSLKSDSEVFKGRYSWTVFWVTEEVQLVPNYTKRFLSCFSCLKESWAASRTLSGSSVQNFFLIQERSSPQRITVTMTQLLVCLQCDDVFVCVICCMQAGLTLLSLERLKRVSFEEEYNKLFSPPLAWCTNFTSLLQPIRDQHSYICTLTG